MNTPNLLIIEDDEVELSCYSQSLTSRGYTIKTATSISNARRSIEQHHFDALLLDLNLPDGNSIEWITEIRKNFEHIAIIIITGNSDIGTAVRAMKCGADNYLLKPVSIENLEIAIQKSLEIENLRKKTTAYTRLSTNNFEPYFGTSPAIETLLEHASMAAQSKSIVFLTGETGTGKGILARWIHGHSAWKNGEFVELNCSSLKGELLRSELFGHTRGSFTSAIQDRIGLVEVADGGTLFLDEIGDMDMVVQAQLLKTIEEKSFRRIGENRVRNSNFRLTCATNKDLLRSCKDGTFRSDLYYRICVFPIQLPPLRERREDIVKLAEHIFKSFDYPYLPMSQELSALLCNYDWPGNIRELRNMLERALLLAQGEPVGAKHFPGLSTPGSASLSQSLNTWKLEELERYHINEAMKFFNNDKYRASSELGISLASLYRKLDKYKPPL